MLTLDNTVLEDIVTALQFIHRNNNYQNPGNPPPGLTLANNPGDAANKLVTISYGVDGVQTGAILMERGQFRVSGASQPNTNTFKVGFPYNHSSTPNKNYHNYLNALHNNDLGASGGDQNRSALIILTSECCRSNMVYRAIRKLIDTQGVFPDDVWEGLVLAIQNYEKTSRYVNYNIEGGASPWTALTSSDYKKFFGSPEQLANQSAKAHPDTYYITAVENYYA